MSRLVSHTVLAATIALALGACKSGEPCTDACKNLASAAKAGADQDTHDRCIRECSAWPEDLRDCMVEARDQRSIEVCMQKAYKMDADRATQRAPNAPAEAAPTPPKPPAAPEAAPPQPTAPPAAAPENVAPTPTPSP